MGEDLDWIAAIDKSVHRKTICFIHRLYGFLQCGQFHRQNLDLVMVNLDLISLLLSEIYWSTVISREMVEYDLLQTWRSIYNGLICYNRQVHIVNHFASFRGLDAFWIMLMRLITTDNEHSEHRSQFRVRRWIALHQIFMQHLRRFTKTQISVRLAPRCHGLDS